MGRRITPEENEDENIDDDLPDVQIEGKYAGLKFRSFTKLVETIGGDKARFSRKLAQTAEDTDTLFTESLTLWNDQDHSSHYTSFVDDLAGVQISTYAQLLHNKDFIVKTLLKHMGSEDCRSIPAFCELTSSLARDLKEEFYEYMWMFFDVLINVLDVGERDKDSLEAAFFCLSLLFKILCRKLSVDIKKVFTRFIPLFGSSRQYIRRFASEVFAFLFRRIADLRKMVPFIVDQVYKVSHDYLKSGCGTMFFFVYKGIGCGFHSAAKEQIRDIVGGVLSIENAEKRNYGIDILRSMLMITVQYHFTKSRTPEFSLLETALLELLETCTTAQRCSDIAQLLTCLFADRNGQVFFTSKQRLADSILNMTTSSYFLLDTHVSTFISQACVKVLYELSWNAFTKDVFATITAKPEQDFTVMSSLFEAVSSLHAFDLYVMPALGRFAGFVYDAKDPVAISSLLSLYAKVITQRRPVNNALNRTRSAFFDVSHHSATKTHVLSVIADLTKASVSSKEVVDVKLLFLSITFQLVDAAAALVIWPWLYTQIEKVQGTTEVSTFLGQLLEKKEQSLEISQLAFITCAALYQVDKTLLKTYDSATVESFLTVQRCCESSLKLYQMHCNVSDGHISTQDLKRVLDCLSPTYLHANSAVRATSMEILSSFKVPLESKSETDNCFSIILSAEKCELIDCRGRLMHLRRLMYGAHLKHLPSGLRQECEEIILRFALSQFFVQFTLLWPGMHELLTSFARGMDIDRFWTIVSSSLEQISVACDNPETTKDSAIAFLVQGVDVQNRFNNISARIQILKFLGKVCDIAERRTRVLSPLVLDFYRTKVKPCLTDDLLKELSENDNEEATGSKDTQSMQFPDIIKTLVAFLEVYSKFSDANSVAKQREIREMYEEILLCGNATLHKAVLACFYTYKNRAINAYKDNLDQMVEEKTLRDQLVLLKIYEDEDDATVHVEHRDVLMNIMLRLLCGKLRTRTKRGMGQSRQAAVLRFVGGCRAKELQFFLDLIARSLINIAGPELNHQKISDLLNNSKDAEKVHTGRVKELLSVFSDLIRNIAHVIGTDQQTFIFRGLLCIAAIVKKVLASGDVPKRIDDDIKDIRMLLGATLAEFFTSFPSRTMSVVELQDLLSLFIMPYIAEGKTSADKQTVPIAPLAVLKLLAAWAASPSRYDLLCIQVDWSGARWTLLDLMICPLVTAASGISEVMLKTIRGGILQMLMLADAPSVSEKLEGVQYMDVTPCKDANLGTSLLVAHLPRLLQFLTEAIETDGRKGTRQNPDNLEIINQMSDYVSDGVLGRRVAVTLLAMLERGVKKDETASKMVSTLARLVSGVEEPEEFVRRIGPLFSAYDSRTSRDGLTMTTTALSRNSKLDTNIREWLPLMAELDSVDRRRMNEPDHDRRHAAYQKLYKIWSDDKPLQPLVVVMFAHTHYHTIDKATDLAIRSTCASNMRALVEHVGRAAYEDNDRRTIVDRHLLQLLARGLKLELEAAREEWLRLFPVLVDSFPSHRELSGLVALRNKDEDLDFFTCVAHIQVHRRQRAFFRLVEKFDASVVSIPFETLQKYFLPIIMPYLVNVKSNTAAVSDEALRVLTTIMRLAPWSRYVQFLESWLAKLNKENDGEKPIIRVLVAVIEAFHFDIADVVDAAVDVAEDEDKGVEPTKEGTEEKKEKATPAAIRYRVLQSLLPQLARCINGKGASKEVHRKARSGESKYYYEEDDILRAPVALATVKLLMKMPEGIRKQYLHGVVLKLCSLMISRSATVREIARKVTVQVCDCLGPKYLPFVIREMKLIMNKGFQLHVMIFTVHALIYAMQNRLSVGDLDPCIPEVLEISVADQFSTVAEEKEIGAIKAEVSEAKSNRTPDTFQLLGRFIGQGVVGSVLDKMREVVETKVSAKVIIKVGDLLHKFALGLKENKGMTVQTQLVLVHQVLDNNIVQMENVGKKPDQHEKKSLRTDSCLVLAPEPKRVGALVKASVKSRVHVFVEFGLSLLAALLKEKLLDVENADDMARLDPFVPLVTRCLKLKYDKVLSNALRCTSQFLHMNLPAIRGSLKEITERLFVLLADYSALGNAGANSGVVQLTRILFKAFTQIIHVSEAEFLTKKHIALLLSYVETDVLDSQKQATAFALIKAIVKKNISSPRVPEVLKTLAQTSITSTMAHVRAQCRDTLLLYIGNHPDSGPPQAHIEFFLAQLEYDFEDGRMSAAETLHALFKNLLPKVLDEVCMLSVVKMGAQLVNDDVPKCRKFCATALRTLLAGVSPGMKDEAAAAAIDWLESEKESLRAVGLQVLVELSEVESSEFVKRLPNVLEAAAEVTEDDQVIENNSESTLVSLLEGMAMMLKHAGQSDVVNVTLLRLLKSLAPLAKCQSSGDVRWAAAVLVGQSLASAPQLWTSTTSEMETVELMLEWMCWQLKDRILSTREAEQASKNIVFLCGVVSEERLVAVVRRLEDICRFEIRMQAKEALKRMSCFKLAAAIAVKFAGDKKKFDAVVDRFLPLLVREMNRKSASNTEELYTLATEIGEVLRLKMGDEQYNIRLAMCQKDAVEKAHDRKRKLKELAVTAPEEAADLKRKKNLKKVVARKRKIDEMKPYRVGKRAHAERQRKLENEDD